MEYILLKPSIKAGIGDAILSLIQAISYAKLTNRTLSVDWRGGMYGMPPEHNLFERIFDINGVPYSSEIPNGDSVYPPVWENLLHKTFEQIRIDNNFNWDRNSTIAEYSIDVSNLDYKQDVVVMWDFDQFDKIMPSLIKNKVIENCFFEHIGMGQIFNKYLSFKDEPSNYIESNWDNLLKDLKYESIIGVHVRDTFESMDCYGSLNRKKYFKAVDSILKKDKKAKLIFLATDNIEVQKEFVSRYGDKVFFKKKWFAKPGSPLHQSRDECPDHWENILDAIFDIVALSKCDYLVRRKQSSFSALSQSIGEFDIQNVKILDKDKSIKIKLSVIKSMTKSYINDVKSVVYN